MVNKLKLPSLFAAWYQVYIWVLFGINFRKYKEALSFTNHVACTVTSKSDMSKLVFRARRTVQYEIMWDVILLANIMFGLYELL